MHLGLLPLGIGSSCQIISRRTEVAGMRQAVGKCDDVGKPAGGELGPGPDRGHDAAGLVPGFDAAMRPPHRWRLASRDMETGAGERNIFEPAPKVALK